MVILYVNLYIRWCFSAGIWSREEQDFTGECWGLQEGAGFPEGEREEAVYICGQAWANNQHSKTGEEIL